MSNKHNRNLVIFSVIFLIMIIFATWMYMAINKTQRVREKALTEAEILKEMISRIVPGDSNADPKKIDAMVDRMWEGNEVLKTPPKGY